MIRVTTAEQSRENDQSMIKNGTPGIVLMENAAIAVFNVANNYKGDILIMCGCGNNGGDGFAAARQLVIAGRNVKLGIIGSREKIKGDAEINYKIAENIGIDMQFISTEDELLALINAHYGIIIDAMFGTGLCRDVGGLFLRAIQLINEKDCVKIAVDIPSGINSDNGRVMKDAIKADETITFHSAKRGHMLYPGREYSGKITVAHIGMPLDKEPSEFYYEDEDIKKLIPKRKPDSHKGTYGKGLLIGGASKYAGAIVMSATACMRSGIGLLKVICSSEAATAINSKIAEVMVTKNDDFELTDETKNAIDWANATAIGCGMGDSNNALELIKAVLESKKPCVIDADGLNLMSRNRDLLSLLHENVIVTPHLMEFSRLTGRSIDEIKVNPIDCGSEFVKKYGCNLLLKGSTTIIFSNDGKICYNVRGSSAQAKGGSGDTLTGLILSLIAGGVCAFYAACAGAYIAGRSAEYYAELIKEGLVLPTDISEMFGSIDSIL